MDNLQNFEIVVAKDRDLNKKKEPITTPKEAKSEAITRAIIGGVIESVPGGSVVTGIGRVIKPSQAEINTNKWQEDISARVNEHEKAIVPSERIYGLNAVLISELIKQCPNGMAEKSYDLAELCVMFPDVERKEIENAVHDLKLLGLLRTRDWIGGWAARLSPSSYEQIDRQIMNWDTRSDALTIAKLMIQKNNGDAKILHESIGWSFRRFNPSFAFLLSLFPEGRVSREIQPDYPSLYVCLMPDDYATLRRFVRESDDTTPSLPGLTG